ncbi:hypothetical protein QE152_g41167, partial [Popillia japonica]
MAATSTTALFSIEIFEPSKTRFDRWLERLESAYTVFNVQTPVKKAYLLHYMGPEAYDIICDKTAPKKPSEYNY